MLIDYIFEWINTYCYRWWSDGRTDVGSVWSLQNLIIDYKWWTSVYRFVSTSTSFDRSSYMFTNLFIDFIVCYSFQMLFIDFKWIARVLGPGCRTFCGGTCHTNSKAIYVKVAFFGFIKQLFCLLSRCIIQYIVRRPSWMSSVWNVGQVFQPSSSQPLLSQPANQPINQLVNVLMS